MFYSVAMPLSDHEKRMLQEMEAALMTEDPRLVSALSGTGSVKTSKRVLIGAALLVTGILVLFAGLISKLTQVGVLGFAIALIGVVSVISSLGKISAPRNKPGAGLTSRLENRWDKRANDQ
jgi:hypothetical protein